MTLSDQRALLIWQELRHEQPETRIAIINAYEEAQRDCFFAIEGRCNAGAREKEAHSVAEQAGPADGHAT